MKTTSDVDAGLVESGISVFVVSFDEICHSFTFTAFHSKVFLIVANAQHLPSIPPIGEVMRPVGLHMVRLCCDCDYK